MHSRFDEIVETLGLAVPAVVATLLARRWWLRRRALPPDSRPSAANDSRIAGSHDEAEPTWPASFEIGETCRRINRNMAAAAHAARRGRPVVELANRRRLDELMQALRDDDDETAWAALEPITVTGEVVGIIESVRRQSGEFSAHSLRLRIERLWSQRIARDGGERDATPAERRTDPGAFGPPPG